MHLLQNKIPLLQYLRIILLLWLWNSKEVGIFSSSLDLKKWYHFWGTILSYNIRFLSICHIFMKIHSENKKIDTDHMGFYNRNKTIDLNFDGISNVKNEWNIFYISCKEKLLGMRTMIIGICSISFIRPINSSNQCRIENSIWWNRINLNGYLQIKYQIMEIFFLYTIM